MKNITLSLVTLLLISNYITAQDQHFSQFYNSPINMNPGNTGVFNGDLRLYTLYRMQWFTVATPYKTFTVSADAPIFKKRMRNKDFFSAGININNDNQGTVRLKTNSYNALVSFTKFIGGRQKHNITLGYEIGYVTKTANLGSIKWDSQWDGTQYNEALPSGEPWGGGSASYLDMSTGLVWTFTTDHLFRSALGFSFHHFTAPSASINSGYEKLYPKFSVQWNSNFKLSEGSNTTIEPSLMAAQQGTSLLLNVGANIKYVLTEHSHYTKNESDKAVHIGLFYRLKDALFIAFRFDYQNISAALAYDVNISGLTPASHTVGGLELMLSYRGLFGHKESKLKSTRFMN